MNTPISNQNLNLLCKRFLSIVSLLFFGISVFAQLITISEGTYLCVKSSSEIYTDTIFQVKSRDLAKLGADNEKKQFKNIANNQNKKSPIQKRKTILSVEKEVKHEQNYTSLPAGKHLISQSFNLVSGIFHQNNFQKIIKLDFTVLITANDFSYKNNEVKNHSENLKNNDKNISYRQRPPPEKFL